MKICLCGSTRFMPEYHEWNRRLSKAGHVVYSVAAFEKGGDPLTEDEKETLDLVHLRKIQESELIFIITVIVSAEGDVSKPYIGDSTRREIKWAKLLGKPVYTDCDLDMTDALITIPSKILAEIGAKR